LAGLSPDRRKGISPESASPTLIARPMIVRFKSPMQPAAISPFSSAMLLDFGQGDEVAAR